MDQQTVRKTKSEPTSPPVLGEVDLQSKVMNWDTTNRVDETSSERTKPEVKADDSVSNVGSGSHQSSRSTASSRARERAMDETARRKALEAKMQYLQQQQALDERRLHIQRRREDEEMQLKQEEEIMKMKSEIDQAAAREQVYRDCESEVEIKYNEKANNYKINAVPLNVHALPFQPTDDIMKQMITIQDKQSQFMEHLIQQQTLSSGYLTLPKTEVPTFNGDPSEYTSFIHAFENIIEAKTSDASQRLYFLIQYTKGDVQNLIKSCLCMKPDDGYQEARRLLKKTYGADYKIAAACIAKVTDTQCLKADDVVGLQRFAINLTSCNNILKEVGYISKMDNMDNLRKIIAKLPFDARKRWRFKADNITENLNRDVQLEDIVKFVTAEARIATHPVFGDISGDAGNEKKTQQKTKATSFLAQTCSEKGPCHDKFKSCLKCGGDHRIQECAQFKANSYEERLIFAKSKGLCFNCLIPKHLLKDCRKRPSCTECDRKHSTLLHRPATQANNGYVDTKAASDMHATIALPIIPVKIKTRGNPSPVITYAFLDGGSNSTFCTKALLDELGIRGTKTQISLTTIEKANSDTESEVVSLEVYDLEEKHFFELPTVFCRPSLPVSYQDIPKQADIDRWPHLHDVSIFTVDARVGILIGNDNAHVIEPKEIIPSKDGGPYATRTHFGWLINGPMGRHEGRPNRSSFFIRADSSLEHQFTKYCNLEFNDTCADITPAMSQEDKKALTIMEQSIKKKDGHYEVALPWREGSPELPNNKPVAEHRLALLKRRLIKNHDLHKKYSTFMDTLMKKDYAEKIPMEACGRSDGMVWYLPHHPVINPKKPDKVRVVFDCAATYRGSSLNDKLLQGPDMTNTLFGVLTRFRQGPIAMMADIEAMFYQVRVEPDHCDALRFLWWPSGDLDSKVEEYRMKVHIFGATSSPSCSNFALRKNAVDCSVDFSQDIIDTVNNNFYVDDCLKSTDSEAKAINIASELRRLLSNGGFRLTKWTSNSQAVMNSIPESERATTSKTLDFEQTQIQRALGMEWNVKSDTFGFNITIEERPPTRRGILSVVSSVYDPLGFVAPFVLPAKILLQELCRLRLGWDDPIPEEHLAQWSKWTSDLKMIEGFKANRCIMPADVGEVMSCQLHHFSDASEIGYGAVSYLLVNSTVGKTYSTFMMAKSRVTPLKQITIPRLELSAATVSVRLDKMIRRELEIPLLDSVFWTDSTSVLRYIENEDKRFHTFVANRIAAIRDHSHPSQWRYVDTRTNPADKASRGLSAEALLNDKQWLMGPEFLLKQEAHWPERPASMCTLTNDDPEIKQLKKSYATVKEPTPVAPVCLFHYHSSWSRLKKCVAWILRYKEKLKTRVSQRHLGQLPTRPKTTCKLDVCPITVDEINQAETEILKYVQRQHYSDEIRSLKKDKIVKKTSSLYKLDPLLRNDMIRVGGRLSKAEVSEDAKHQIILPKKSVVTDLLIRHYHTISAHSGREYILSLLRRRFWIIKGNSAVRKVLTDCFDCRKRQGPVLSQKMADLPSSRVVSDKPPFATVGIDFFGPFEVKRGRSLEKRYACIFTCLAIRAVHIEVTHTLNTDSFINALRRFIARRGPPEEIRTDNGGNFVCAEKDIRESIAQWNQQKIHDFLLQQAVRWVFNPPYASHQGGIWERCIRTARKILNVLLKEQTLVDESLATLMCEVESIMNGRPITKVSEDHRDCAALTPNHLLLLRSATTFPPGVFRKEDLYSRRKWRQVQYLSDQFWKRWLCEYLPLLQVRQKWLTTHRNLQVGDLVLLKDESAPRGSWPMALVVETFPDEHGIVRQVVIKSPSGKCRRDIRKLCLLEAS